MPDSSALQQRPDYWAALDLGSNSFHLLLVRRAGASFVVVERLKEKVQLLGGFADGRMTDAATQRGLQCLARFSQRLQGIGSHQICAMGTCALRQADNADAFVLAAQQVLSAPVQVISGEEEARLIYAAVAHHLGRPEVPRLVIDIGGGSTELALDRAASLSSTQPASVNLGCVALKDRFFVDGRVLPDAYQRARAFAVDTLTQVLDPTLSADCKDDALAVFGTSGSIESILAVLRANGWSSEEITAQALGMLEDAMIADAWLIDAGLPGLAPERVDIFPAGVAILSACFEVLRLRSMAYVDVTLLQGIICERLIGDETMADLDLRQDSVDQLAQRFSVDPHQARRVIGCAQTLFDQAGGALALGEDDRRLLQWAAQLHELGVHINARHYHRHGGYIIKHTEMAGFTETEQSMLALLVRGHRRSMPGLAFHAFDPQLAERLLKLVILLRIAVILQRSHTDADAPQMTLNVDGPALQLSCGEGWLAAHPLSAKELEVEAGQLATAGYSLVVAD